jgi:hypothetical protein
MLDEKSTLRYNVFMQISTDKEVVKAKLPTLKGVTNW